MTKEREFKDKVRERMAKTGESYTAARAMLAPDREPGLDEDDGYDPLDTLDEAGLDAEGLPMYAVGNEVLTYREALEHLVEEGLADPELLRDE